jgi:hypothetical protein
VSDSAALVTDAVVRLQCILKLSDTDIGAVLGLDRHSVVRRKKAHELVREGEKPWEAALLLIRMFRSLSAILGEDEMTLRYWLKSHNSALGGRPSELIKTTEGLARTVMYLDAMREKPDVISSHT